MVGGGRGTEPGHYYPAPEKDPEEGQGRYTAHGAQGSLPVGPAGSRIDVSLFGAPGPHLTRHCTHMLAGLASPSPT